MRSLHWGLTFSLLNPVAILASASNVVTVRINTGVCTPSGSPNGNGGGNDGGPNGNGGGNGGGPNGNGGGYGGGPNGNGGGYGGGPNGDGGNNSGGSSTGSTFVQTVDSSYGIYDFYGVYAAPSSGDLLNGQSYTSNDLTLASCASFCLGSEFFALEYGNRCNCGSVPPSTFKSGILICGYGCSGDAAECCGYSSSYVVYSSRSLTPSVSSSVIVYTTTDSQGNTITATSTSVTTYSNAPASPSVTVITSTDAQGSTILSTSTIVGQPSNSAPAGATTTPGIPNPTSNPPPGGSTTTPSGDTTPPSDTTTAPGDTATAPGDTATAPGDTATAPGDTATAPSNTATAPGDTATAPSSTATSPATEAIITHDPACGADNNTLFTDFYSTQYDIRCGLQVVGQTYLTIHADSFTDCLDYCSIRSQCLAVTFQSSQGTPNEQSTNCQAYITFEGYSTPATADLASGVPVDGSTPNQFTTNLCDPASPSLSTTDNNGNSYNIVCGSGYVGDNLIAYQATSLRSCLEYCQYLTGCIVVVFTGYPVDTRGANCYPKLKGANNAPEVNAGNQYAILQSAAAP